MRARTEKLAASDVEAALASRELVVSWLNRGTLHLVRPEDYHWLQALTTPPLRTAVARRLREEGVSEGDAERSVGEIERALADQGPLTRPQLRERLDSAGLRTEGQALVHLLFLASLRGLIVRGPVHGKQHAFVLVRDWLGEPPPFDRDVALAELARRYLAGHTATSDRDLANWAGLPLRDARAGLEAIAGEIEEGEDGLLRLARRGSAAELPPPRLLGPFDPVLHGWASRKWVLGEREPEIVKGGLFGPFAMAEGRAVGGWRWDRGEARLGSLAALRASERGALERDAEDVVRFLTS